jgi:hypothetical protein
VRTLSSADALAMLKFVEPKVYKRTDGPEGIRAGFLAQQVQAALPAEWQNIVNSTATPEILSSEGEVTHPADPDLLQLDYSRLGSPILWSCCRTLLERIETLEAAVARLL